MGKETTLKGKIGWSQSSNHSHSYTTDGSKMISYSSDGHDSPLEKESTLQSMATPASVGAS